MLLSLGSAGQEGWRHAVQLETVRHDDIDQRSHEASCTRSIQLAQQASQACQPDGQADTHNEAQTVQQQEGILTTYSRLCLYVCTSTL